MNTDLLDAPARQRISAQINRVLHIRQIPKNADYFSADEHSTLVNLTMSEPKPYAPDTLLKLLKALQIIGGNEENLQTALDALAKTADGLPTVAKGTHTGELSFAECCHINGVIDSHIKNRAKAQNAGFDSLGTIQRGKILKDLRAQIGKATGITETSVYSASRDLTRATRPNLPSREMYRAIMEHLEIDADDVFAKARLEYLESLAGPGQQALLQRRRRARESNEQSIGGFSLIQLSLILMVGGMILAATLPGGPGDDMAKQRITLERMERIEAATQQFMTNKRRRPYPADITADFSSASFGVELAVPTNYSLIPTTHFATAKLKTFTTSPNVTTLTGGDTSNLTKGMLAYGTHIVGTTSNLFWVESITSSSALIMNRHIANSATGATTNVYFRNPLVAGGVPTKALGLPDEYAIDGYGRRLVYMVDARITTNSGCLALQNNNLKGALALARSSSFNTDIYDNVMWALLSYGKDGQGAVGIQGSALTSRIKTKNTDADSLANAFYDSSEAKSYNPSGLVNKPTTSTFDDIVWTSNATKNICGTGDANNTPSSASGAMGIKSFKDFRINGNATGTTNPTNGITNTSIAVGDINGDGWPDIVNGVGSASSNAGAVRVVFGKKGGWPDTSTAPLPGFDTSTLDGNNGFSLVNDNGSVTFFGAMVTTGDINGDGYDDIIAGGLPAAITDYAYVVLFGRASWPSSLNASTMDGTIGFRIAGLDTRAISWRVVADFNGDGYDDISLPFATDGAGGSDWAQGVMFGKPSGSWSSTYTFGTALLNGNYDLSGTTTGVYFRNTSPYGTTYGRVGYGDTAGATIGRRVAAACDYNGDGYTDLIAPGLVSGAATQPQRLYLYFGATGNTWTAASSSGLIELSGSTMLSFPTDATGASPTYTVRSIGCRDINSDGKDDILMYLYGSGGSPTEKIYAYFGSTSTANQNIDDTSVYNIRFDLATNKPSWQDTGAFGYPAFSFGDINNDGFRDLILGRLGDDPCTVLSGSTFSINNVVSGCTPAQRADAGTIYVLYQPTGCVSAPTTCWSAASPPNVDFFSGGYAAAFNGTDGIKMAGIANFKLLAEETADINKDGKDDIIISHGNNVSAIHGGFVIFGKSTWPNPYDGLCLYNKSGANCTAQVTAK